MNTETAGIETLRSWLLEQHPDLDIIDDDTDLFEHKLLNSINFVEYILIIEEIIDRDVPVTPDLVMKTATLAKVREHFLVGT